MILFDLAIFKVTTPDSYCGYDELCVEGATQVFSFLIWSSVIFISAVVGHCIADWKRIQPKKKVKYITVKLTQKEWEKYERGQNP